MYSLAACVKACLTLTYSECKVGSLCLAAQWGLMTGLKDPMTWTSAPCRPTGTGQPHVLAAREHGFVIANASSCSLTNFLSPSASSVQKYEVYIGAGIQHINTLLSFLL